MLPPAERSMFARITLRRVIALAVHALGNTERALDEFAATAAEARARQVPGMTMEADVFRAQLLADGGQPDEALAITRTVATEARESGSESTRSGRRRRRLPCGSGWRRRRRRR
jgi:ATP/maltotriose-dependent transcriptional regulator MalT